MRKSVLFMGILAVLFASCAYYYKILYPPLPFQSLSQKEVAAMAKNHPDDVVMVAEENGYEWYVIEKKQKDAVEETKKMLGKYGWEYQKKDGGKLIFQKGEQPIKVAVTPWSKNYQLAKIPAGWKY